MSNLTQVIKKIAKEERENSDPSDIYLGNVRSISPLKIQVSSKITLDSDFLIICESASHIAVGDKVALIRSQGGQRYLVVDKVV